MNQAQRDRINQFIQAGQHQAAFKELQYLGVWDDEALQAAKRFRELYPINTLPFQNHQPKDFPFSPSESFLLCSFLNLGFLLFIINDLFTSVIENVWCANITKGVALAWFLLVAVLIYNLRSIGWFKKSVIIFIVFGILIQIIDNNYIIIINGITINYLMWYWLFVYEKK